MTPDQVRLVQESFAKLVPIADQAASMFYERLFEIAPQVRAMFPPDMAEQQRKLMATLTIVVGGLSNLESILPAASSLATRHVAYGARPEHYPVVGAALLWTLEQGLGKEWNEEVADAWTAAYAMLSDFMIKQAWGRPQAAE
jgi:hemoglobin-like flavoprotein